MSKKVSGKNDADAASIITNDGKSSAPITQDIIKREKAEEKLRESEERFAKAFNASPLAFTITSLKTGKLVEVNETFVNMTGFSREEAIGRSTAELGLWNNAPDREKELAAVVGDGKIRNSEYRFLMKDGSEIVGLLSAELLELGGEPCALTVIQDITTRKQTEENLKYQKTLLEALTESVLDGILIVSADGRMLYSNQRFHEIWKFPPEVVESQSDKLALEWEAAQTMNPKGFLARVETIYDQPDNEVREEIVMKDGRVFDRFGAPIQHADGQYGWVWTFRDITDRKNAEDALREINQRFSATYEFAPVGIVESSPEGRYINGNEQFCAITGYNKKELSEFGIEEITHAEDFSTDIELHRKLVDGAIPSYQIEKRYVRKDGSIVWCELYRSAVRDAAGKTLYTIGAVSNITTRKFTEEALRESEENYRVLAETASDAIIRIDEASTIRFVNTAAERIFGYAMQEMVGQPLMMLMPEEMRPQHYAGFSRYMQTGKRKLNWESIEVPAQRKNGEQFPLEISFGEYNRDGRRFFIGIARDITERKQAEAERERFLISEQEHRRQAEESNRLKDEFLATVSHELRTPLNAILGWATMVRKGGYDPETMRRAFDVVERNSRNQNQIISDILDVSRIITGKLNLNLYPLHLTPILRAAIDTLHPAIEAKHLKLKTNFKPDTAKVSGDGDRLQQVMWNLLSNAVKFTPDGGTIEIALFYRDNFAEIVVTDSGEGIKQDFLPYVFDRFRQEDGSANRRHGGLGLGLSIVRNLVELHGGTVAVKNRGSGQGAVFTVHLPLKSGKSAAAAKNKNADDAQYGILKGLRILVVDDEADALELAAFILGGEGAEVFTADSVDEALEIFDKESLDAIVSDIGMPGKDGYNLIEEIKKRASRSKRVIPTVALTAYAGDREGKRVTEVGFDAHLPKPVEPSQLIETIAEVTKKLRGE